MLNALKPTSAAEDAEVPTGMFGSRLRKVLVLLIALIVVGGVVIAIRGSAPEPPATSVSDPATAKTALPSPNSTSSNSVTAKGGGSTCAAVPSSCGYPDASNTGVVAGTSLRQVPAQVTSGPGWHYDPRGWVTIDGDGAVLENLQIPVAVDVEADNVTIRNVRFTTSGEGWAIALRHTNNAVVSDVEILPNGPRLTVGIKDIYGDGTNTKVLRTEIVRITTGVQIYSGLIQDNYIHDFAYQSGDHLNGTTSNGSTVPLTIRHNTIFNQYQQTDAISLFQDFGLEANRVIDNNLLAGGGYTIYGGQNPGAALAYNIKITNNRISRKFFPNGGYYGPITAFNPNAPGNVWTGNTWDEDNQPISL